MYEVIFTIFVTFSTGPTEVYEYPMENMKECSYAVQAAHVGNNVSIFCVIKPESIKKDTKKITESDVF